MYIQTTLWCTGMLLHIVYNLNAGLVYSEYCLGWPSLVPPYLVLVYSGWLLQQQYTNIQTPILVVCTQIDRLAVQQKFCPHTANKNVNFYLQKVMFCFILSQPHEKYCNRFNPCYKGNDFFSSLQYSRQQCTVLYTVSTVQYQTKFILLIKEISKQFYMLKKRTF